MMRHGMRRLAARWRALTVMAALCSSAAAFAQMPGGPPPPPGPGGPHGPVPPPSALAVGDAETTFPDPTLPPDSAEPASARPEVPVASSKRRDPFWPVGYLPPPPPLLVPGMPDSSDSSAFPTTPGPVLAKPDWPRARAQLKVRGFISGGLDGQVLANINGRLAARGDVVSLRLDGLVYRWRIRSIGTDGAVATEEVDVRPDTQ